MRSVRTAVGAAAGALAVVLLVGGCGAGPRQLSAAAIVDGTEITIGQVQGQFDTVLAREGQQAKAQLAAGHQLDDLSRKILTLRIRHELITIAAQRAGLTVDRATVNRLLTEVGGADAASKGTIFDANGYRQRAEDRLLMAELGRRAVRSSAVSFDYTTADTRTAAEQRVAELSQAGPRQARQLIAADVDAGRDAALDKRVVAADDPIFAATPAFGVAEGSVLAFQLGDSKPWLIMVIKNHTDRGVVASDHAPNPDQIDPAVLEAIGLRQLAPVAQDVGVQLSPRYGLWDPVGLQVVANENETSGFLATMRPNPQA
ncbi:MAG TPA: SurA N-terminal domain-containing protein [Pseudonocardiaceae bacterium]